jgi:hypothetical protein
VNSLKADSDLRIALTIDQIAGSAKAARTSFLEAAQRAAIEVYREPLTQAAVWPVCAGEWGQDSGFKHRVADHLEKWFGSQSKLKDTLEEVLENLWEQSVVRSLRKVSEENGNDEPGADECHHIPRNENRPERTIPKSGATSRCSGQLRRDCHLAATGRLGLSWQATPAARLRRASGNLLFEGTILARTQAWLSR